MIFLSMNAGAVKYIGFDSGAVVFSDTSVYGKKYDVYGTIIDGSVGAKESYTSTSNFNNTTVTFTFDYDINSANLFGKTGQSKGATNDLSSMVTIDKDKRKVYLKSNLNTKLDDVYLMLWVNGDFGNSYNLVQNLTALENVELATEITRNPLKASDVLRDVGLKDRMNKQQHKRKI